MFMGNPSYSNNTMMFNEICLIENIYLSDLFSIVELLSLENYSSRLV